ncbi:ABC transporter substrate-binding protein [Microtetraspora malaysiensis]|uniref:ABC transporter substrate-binding protein n=1 Tax=Microtetraspora malaysiensis TaxID=161358 RepID=UPI00082C31D1|nr:ABC transporter substrate-binding protein [Microtetraspora malaysiensis]
MRKQRFLITVTAVASLVSLASCASEEKKPQGGAITEGDVFVFGSVGAPKVFDPFYSSDGESQRISSQIFESLLRLKPGTSELEPSLATEWKEEDGGKKWTFELRQGVKFTDGTAFDAKAACFNLDRWYNQKGVAQSPGVTQGWSNDFGGFAGQDKPSLFKSCEVNNDFNISVSLTRYANFPLMMSYVGYAMGSPTAMEKYNADEVVAQGTGFKFPDYALKYPTGTGPFKFVSYDDAAGTVTLERNEDYWGDKAKVQKVIFRIIPDETTRRQELEAGTIHAYDVPNPVDWTSLRDAGMQVLSRDGYNILYIGFNASTAPELKDFRVRQALMYATNRDQLVQTRMPEGTVAATQFIPPLAPGFNPDLKAYPYDPEKAKELLAEAGHPNLEIELWYPTEVSRPYMPNPQAVFEAVRDDWEKVGIKVNPVAKPWNGGYLDGRDQGKAPAYLLGSIWHYGDSTVGTFFGVTDNAFATKLYPFGKELAAEVIATDSESDPEKSKEKNHQLQANIMNKYLPSLPIAHVPSAMAAAGNVKGLVPSPFGNEIYSSVFFE